MLAAIYGGFAGAAWADAKPAALGLALMFALVPLVNIPFDWFSLGLTRALLRRGCEDGAPSPLWLGLLDFVFGLFLLVLLALALIAALGAADRILAYFGRKPVADVVALLDGIAANPRDPANYWAYFTLFSTLIPSALNAVIGAASLVTWWLPKARHWVLARLDELDHRDDKGIRVRVAALLGGQVGVGTLLTGGVLWGLWEVLIEMPYVLPEALKWLRALAVFLGPPIT